MKTPAPIRYAFAILTTVLLFVGSTPSQGTPRDPFSRSGELPPWVKTEIDALFARFDSEGPGAALGIARNGTMLYSHGYGLANLEYDIPITPASIFHVASISKQFTAMCIALLAQEGALSLDDEVQRHIPEMSDFGERVTIRHLIHHTSGLRDQWELLGMAGWRGNDVKTQQDILDLVALQRDLNFKPGAEYLYCNTGYTLLAEIVGRVSGQPMKEFAKERIFEPLGMEDTHFHDDVSHIVPGRTYAYRPQADGFGISIPDFENYGATSLFTTVEDLARWADNFRHKQVGGEDVIELMQTRGVLNSGEEITYAFALSHGNHRGLPTLGHSGSDAGYRAQLTMYPDQGLTIAVLSNVSNGNPGGLTRQVAEIVLRDAFPEAVAEAGTAGRRGARGRRGGRGRAVVAVNRRLSSEAAAEYVGAYYSQELNTTYEIVEGEDGLVLRRRRFPDRALARRSEDDFSAGSWRISFTRSASDINGFALTSGRVRNLRFVRM